MSQQATELLAHLTADLEAPKLTDVERTKLLEQLKVIGRNPRDAEPIFQKHSIHTLCRYAFDTGRSAASKEAMRCLANAMLLNEPSRQILIDLDYSSKAADRLKNDDRDDEFLASRLLFFCTYTSKLDIATLVAKHGLSESIVQNLDRAVARSTPDTNPITPMAFQETLKLITNIAYFSPSSVPTLHPALSPLATLLIRLQLPEPILQPPTTLLINALLTLNPPASQVEDAALRDPLYPPADPTALTTRLVDILSQTLTTPLTAQLDTQLSPLLTLLRSLHASAPPDVQASLRNALLPPSSARSKPLGSDSSLASRLIRASADPSAPTVKDLAGALLYELSGSSGAQLVANIGYGYAIGITTRLGVGVDAAALSAEGDVNPITGQRRDAEAEVALADMTDEEKEREAERLFVLFERLKATGVVDVKNPVEMMAEQQS